MRPIIVDIFNRCIAGDSLETIARRLDSEGIPTTRGGKWSKPTIKDIINNRAYMGYIQDNSRKAIGTCPAIIDAAVWRAANGKLHSRPKRGPNKTVDKALCAGSLFCPQCGIDSPMYRLRGGRPNNRILYYRCAGRGAQAKGCGNMVRLEEVDATVDESMSSDCRKIMKRVFVPGHNHTAEIADVDFRMVPRWEALNAEPANGQATGIDPLTQEIRHEVERISGLPYEQASAMTSEEIKAHLQQHQS